LGAQIDGDRAGSLAEMMNLAALERDPGHDLPATGITLDENRRSSSGKQPVRNENRRVSAILCEGTETQECDN
jgi:hypothetical protein